MEKQRSISISLLIVLQVYFLCQFGEAVRVRCEQGKHSNSVIFHREDGFFYHRNAQRGNALYLKCIHYDSTGCQGRAVINRLNRAGLVHTAPHNTHQPDLAHAEVLRVRHRILRRCRRLEYVPFRTIVREERSRVRGPLAREVRSRVTHVRMRTAMRNARLSNYPSPPPRDLRSITDVLQNPRYNVLTMTEDGEDNLYRGSVTDANGHHHVVFATQRMLNVLATSNTVHGDGTFRVVPNIDGVSQIFVIVVTWRHHILPIAWALMESRTQAAYEAVLSLIYNQLPAPVRIRRVITDYERGQQNAWENIFNDMAIRLQGCLWHICRAFVIEAITLGLGFHLRNTPEIRRTIQLCCALPLLPRRLLRRGLVLIIRNAQMELGRVLFRLVRPFFRYLDRYWISNPARRRWMSVFRSYHRTNNACESHNRVLKEVMGGHLNIYLFIRRLLDVETDAYTDLLILQTGQAASRRRRASAVFNDLRIQRLEDDLMNPPGRRRDAILNFLRAAAHHVDNIFENALDDHQQD